MCWCFIDYWIEKCTVNHWKTLNHCIYFVAGSRGTAEDNVAGELSPSTLLLLHSKCRHSQDLSFVDSIFDRLIAQCTRKKLTTSKRNLWTGNTSEVSHHITQQHQEAKENVSNKQNNNNNNNTTKLQYQTKQVSSGGNKNAPSTNILFFLLALLPPLGVVFYSPLVGFSLLAYEVSWSHITTRHRQ